MLLEVLYLLILRVSLNGYLHQCDLGQSFWETVVGGSNWPSPLTLEWRSNNTNNRKYFHDLIFHYLKEIPHIRFKYKIDERYPHDLG